MPEVIAYKKINIDNIIFEKPKKLHDNYRSNIKYRTKTDIQPIYIKTPKLFCSAKIKQHEQGYHYIDFIVDISKNKDFHNFLLSVDETCINQIANKSDKWFGKAIKKNAVENSYRSPLKANRAGINLRARLIYDEYQELSTQIYDSYLNNINIDEIEPNTKIIAILTISGLWISRYATEVRWSVVQMKIFDENNSKLSDYVIDDDSENEEEYYNGNEIIYSDSDNETKEPSLELEDEIEQDN